MRPDAERPEKNIGPLRRPRPERDDGRGRHCGISPRSPVAEEIAHTRPSLGAT